MHSWAEIMDEPIGDSMVGFWNHAEMVLRFVPFWCARCSFIVSAKPGTGFIYFWLAGRRRMLNTIWVNFQRYLKSIWKINGDQYAPKLGHVEQVSEDSSFVFLQELLAVKN